MSWNDISMGLGLIPTTLAISNNDLYAINNGNGIYKQCINNAAGISNINSDEFQVKVYPTTVNASCSIAFDLIKDDWVELIVYDVTGRKVYSHTAQQFSKGSQLLTVNTDNLNNGAYLINIKVGKAVVTKKITVNK